MLCSFSQYEVETGTLKIGKCKAHGSDFFSLWPLQLFKANSQMFYRYQHLHCLISNKVASLWALQGRPGIPLGSTKPMRWVLTMTAKHALFDQPKITSTEQQTTFPTVWKICKGKFFWKMTKTMMNQLQKVILQDFQRQNVQFKYSGTNVNPESLGLLSP